MVRTPCCDQNGMKKGTWTPKENRKLVACVTKYGCWNWRQLPKFAGMSQKMWVELQIAVAELSEAKSQERELHQGRKGNHHKTA
ncbi:hypothetical protein TIFTF001_027137 [Ficus carica]|uniref:Myb-like domain-containing protein n=1 Tax=Ficus carica TaxID=3494 RepID=A0AA88IZ65_FICCA|nr:hypothetical protein TIFTF001_027137 [Ficus carica]